MPEIPDLEAIRSFYNARIVGQEIIAAEVAIPYVIRTGSADFVASMTGNRFGECARYGKFLLFHLDDGQIMVVNAMLTGRFAYTEAKTKKTGKGVFSLTLANGMQMRYSDQRVMGKVYLVAEDALSSIPTWDDMGPDALTVSEEEFRARIRKFTGAIKNILTNHKFIAGIGNAYSDEILFEARIDPFRKRTALKDDDIGRLYRAMGTVYAWAIPLLREHFSAELHYQEWREHLKVHRKGFRSSDSKDEGRCPRCGNHISQVSPNDRVTSWCRTCQT